MTHTFGKQLVALCLCHTLAASAFAESVFGQTPATAAASTTAQQGMPGAQKTAEGSGTPGNPSGGPATSQPAPFTVGYVGLHPHVHYRYVHGDGVQSQPGRQFVTTLHEVSPGITAQLGSAWSLDYTATQSWYSRDEFKDTLGHDVNLNGGHVFQSWTFALSQSFSQNETPLLETASQTKQESASTKLAAAYLISPRTTTDLELTQRYQSATTLGDSFERMASGRLSHRLEQHLSVGLGLGAGYIDIEKRPGIGSTRVTVNLGWMPSARFSVQLLGGVESRNDRAPGVPTTRTPMYNGSVFYAPFEHTRLTAAAGRSSSVSFFNNQLNDSNNWNFGLQQRLLGKLQFSALYNIQRSRYLASLAGVDFGRRDSQKSLALRLGATLRTRGSVGLSYQRRVNDSSLAGYSLGSDQIGVDLGWVY